MTGEPSTTSPNDQYVVVARRYRPQDFEQLVGQSQVAQALHNAIATNRVGHAYLFTGARGVGKTSTARILAKALNCVNGPTSKPCNECDICLGITQGDDVDVIEIDGASNRGIDEIRQLRSNVNVRPSRARFKIYIIDEVHMLTVQAFNALLKTLEEPPEHVKFLFCTTDPEKIPITVLSRCQRFDFPPVETNDIVQRLRFIVDSEGAEADDDALALLARRAAGSMRDSQSLLEQLLSFASGRITLDEVHRMLGSARGGQLGELGEALAARDAAASLMQLDKAIQDGADAGQLTNQLLGYFRDALTAAIGCAPEMLLQSSADDHARLAEIGKQAGVANLLAIIQLLDHAMTRMRQSIHVRTLLEVALVRICQLETLDDLGQLVANLREGMPPGNPTPPRTPPPSTTAPPSTTEPPRTAPPSTTEPPRTAPPSTTEPAAASAPATTTPEAAQQAASPPQQPPASAPPVAQAKPSPEAAPSQPAAEKKTAEGPLEPASAPDKPASDANLEGKSAVSIWAQALDKIEDTTRDFAQAAKGVAITGPNKLVILFEPSYSFEKEQCERAERRSRIEQALTETCGGRVIVDLQLTDDPVKPRIKKKERPNQNARRQAMRDTERHPLVSEAIEIFDAEMIHLEDERPRNGGEGA